MMQAHMQTERRHFKLTRKNHHGILLKDLVVLKQVALVFLVPLSAPKIRTSLKLQYVQSQMVLNVGGLGFGGRMVSTSGTMEPLSNTQIGKRVTIKIMLAYAHHHNLIIDGSHVTARLFMNILVIELRQVTSGRQLQRTISNGCRLTWEESGK